MRKRIIAALLLLGCLAVLVTQCCMLDRVLPCVVVALSGEPGPHAGSAVGSNGLLHTAVLDALGDR